MAQYWLCHLQSYNGWYSSVVYLWVDTWGTEQNMSGVWLHFQRTLIFCVVAPSFPLKLEGPKLPSVRIEWSSCLMLCYSMR